MHRSLTCFKGAAKFAHLYKMSHLQSRTFRTCAILRSQKSEQDETSENKKALYEHFVAKMQEYQLSMGHMVPMSFGTSFDSYDVSRMLLPKFQFNFFVTQMSPEFDEAEFLEGAKEAFGVVRPLLISRDLEALKPLCTESCFADLSSFFDQLDQVNKEGRVLLEGHIDTIKQATIHNIRVCEKDGVMDTVVNVLIVADEAIAFVKEPDTLLLGNREVRERSSILSFIRHGHNGQWQIRAFVK